MCRSELRDVQDCQVDVDAIANAHQQSTNVEWPLSSDDDLDGDSDERNDGCHEEA